MYLDDVNDVLGVLFELWESTAHFVNYNLDELVEEAWLGTEDLFTISHGSSENTTQYISTTFVAGDSSIVNGEGQCAGMISNNLKLRMRTLYTNKRVLTL